VTARQAWNGALTLFAVVLAATATRADAAPLSPLLPQESVVEVAEGEAAWTLIPLPPEVVLATTPARGDLRLFDERGREVPFVMIDATRAEAGRADWVRLERSSIEHEPERTRLVIVRPRGLTMRTLRLDSSSRAFDRPIRVRDLGVGGSGRLLADTQATRALGSSAPLDLAVAVPTGDRLEIEIDDGDSPPLEDLVVRARLRQPALVTPHAGAAVLRFGGGRLGRPHYDLDRLAPSERSAMRVAAVGPARDNPDFDPRPALGFAMRPGPALDAGAFAYRRALRIEAAPEGLSHMTLGLADIGRARADLGDLRIVDDAGQPYPHLVEPTGDLVAAPLTLTTPSTRIGDITTHRFALPAARLSLRRLELVLARPFIDRPYRLVSGVGDQAITIAAGTLRRNHGDAAVAPIELSVAESVTALALEVDDGDDASTEVTSATAYVPRVDLFVAAPPDGYWLLSGSATVPAPRYELAQARRLVLAVSSLPMVLGALEPNPSFRVPERERTSPLLWAVLALAVCVLAAVTLRAVGSQDAPPH
jgi:hypothetical protein